MKGLELKPVPHDYQNTALDFCLQRMYVQGHKGAGLFLDPGLGKTLITLLLLERLRDLGEIENALIVAPLRVCRLVWEQEIEKWGFDFTSNILCGKLGYTLSRKLVKGKVKSVRTGSKPLPKQRFIDLINPESLHHLEDQCHRWDMVAVDESTKFKNWTSKRMKSLRKMLPNFNKRLILTGTPAPNSLADLHSQVFCLDGGAALGRNVTVFRSLYMHQGGWQGREWKLRDGQEGAIHEQVAPLCLRLDAESCLDMPELVEHDIECELPPKCVPQYKQLKRDLLAQLETADVLAMNAASAYMKMRQFANGKMYDSERNVHHVHTAKLEALDEVIGECHGKPVLVFYQFGHDVDAILTKYPKAKVLNGRTKPKDAEKYLKDWNSDKIPIFLVQNQAASHGLNMQDGSCSDVVYFGLPGGNLEVYEQSYRRIYRQGVKGKQVRIHRLLTIGTVDMVIRDGLELKNQTQQQFLTRLKQHAREGI